jgi:hypothetical protein
VWHILPGCAEEGGEKEGSMGTPPGLVGDGHLDKKEIKLIFSNLITIKGHFLNHLFFI